MEELQNKIMEAKIVQKELYELQERYEKYHSTKALARILELKDIYSALAADIHTPCTS